MNPKINSFSFFSAFSKSSLLWPIVSHSSREMRNLLEEKREGGRISRDIARNYLQHARTRLFSTREGQKEIVPFPLRPLPSPRLEGTSIYAQPNSINPLSPLSRFRAPRGDLRHDGTHGPTAPWKTTVDVCGLSRNIRVARSPVCEN